MQRVWNFPIDTKQGCPQDRESSGHVGIRVKKKISHIFIRVQTDTSVCVCVCACAHVCVSASTNSHFALYFRMWGGWEGWIKQRKGNYCLHSGGAFIPLAFHISTGQSPARTLLLPVMMGREEMEIISMSACPILPFVQFLGQQKCFSRPNPPCLPGASALASLNEPRDFSSCLSKVRIWP